MRNEPNFEIFHQAFSSRIEVATALTQALKTKLHDLGHLKKTCEALELIISDLGQGEVENDYRSFHIAIDIFVLLVMWKNAIRNAEQDAQRFLKSAKLKASEIDKSFGSAADGKLEMFLARVIGVESVDELVHLQELLKRWTLPLLLFSNPRDQSFGRLRPLLSNGTSDQSVKRDTTVAFLKFDIDGEPAKHYNYLKPGTSYDLTIEVRVSNWPEEAKQLFVTPISIDPRERNWLPDFKFVKPEGDEPYILTGIGRAVLEIAHSFGSRPYEFLYAAEFDDTSNSHDVAIVGHRRLLLEGCDVVSTPLSGFSNVDRHLLSVRNKLRTLHGLHSVDIANTMILLAGLGNIAAQALKAGIFEAETSEKQFQNKASDMLRNRSDIGEHLQGHPEAAGGITDLTFRDIPIELKVENSKVQYAKDFSKYFNQTAAYSIGLGKRIGVLSVLESSPKSNPVGILEDDIEVFFHPSGQSNIAIVVVVIRGGFPKPSSYSR